MPIAVVVDYQASCAAGVGVAALRQALAGGCSGLIHNRLPHSGLDTWTGHMDGLDHFQWPEHLLPWQSRNNALLELALQQGSLLTSLGDLTERFGRERVGIVMGSSTSSIDRAEQAYRELDPDGRLAAGFLQDQVLNPHSPGLYVAHRLELNGPNMTINTACSSSAKVFATGARWLQTGLVDAVLVGGADTLCLSVLHGFQALQLVSTQVCRPFDEARDGINLGEAAGFALLVRAGEANDTGIHLSGYGESSDAHHMSHPHPQGKGARLAIDQALLQAGLLPHQIDYINMHGTASRANDHIEGNLLAERFGNAVRASSTKGWTGHTLGAAGILEAIITIDALQTGLVPGTLNLQNPDPAIALTPLMSSEQVELHHVMSNSFGFGGNNASLIFSKATKVRTS